MHFVDVLFWEGRPLPWDIPFVVELIVEMLHDEVF